MLSICIVRLEMKCERFKSIIQKLKSNLRKLQGKEYECKKLLDIINRMRNASKGRANRANNTSRRSEFQAYKSRQYQVCF